MDEPQAAVTSMEPAAAAQTAPWQYLASRTGGPIGLLALFIAVDALLLVLGFEFEQTPTAPTVLWPSAGWLVTCLFLAGPRRWLVVGAFHMVTEVIVTTLLHTTLPLVPLVLIAGADLLDGIVGASLCLLLLREPSRLNLWQVFYFIGAVAIGALAGAVPGAAVNYLMLNDSPGYLNQVQLWWAGNWVGSLVVAPAVYSWAGTFRKRYPELALRSRWELAVLALVMLSAALYVFTAAPGRAIFLGQLPLVLVAIVIFAAFRLPPRWVQTLVLLVIFIGAEMASRGQGPFASDDVFYSTASMQLFCGSLAVVAFMLATAVAAMRVTLRQLGYSEYRYRNFVELSSEAVWCVEFDSPMSLQLDVSGMRQWFSDHARLIECSQSFRDIDPEDAGRPGMPLRANSVWTAAYMQYLDDVAKHRFSCDDLRVVLPVSGRKRDFLTSFDGVIESGHLVRIWGVARDVTELSELNSRLLREQERLRSYARQIVTAEERARRATAVDLHDGIGQSLTSVCMNLEVARKQATPDVRLLLDEMKTELADVQERTRGVISDLSPPGLYELGLVPALQWLIVHMRTHDNLHAELESQVKEAALNLDLRVLVFKLVRELLRNVVKHAAVTEASVRVRGGDEQLVVEVSDEGRGFEWQLDMFGTRRSGFGLWNMADRVAEVGGSFEVDAAPGHGARFALKFPLAGHAMTGRVMSTDDNSYGGGASA